DTFIERCSPEIEEGGQECVAEWVQAAVRGEWKGIDQVHGLVGRSLTAVAPVKDSLEAARLARRVASGQASCADLVALKNSALGAGILSEYREQVLPLIQAGTQQGDISAEVLAELLPAHLPELVQQARSALNSDPPGEWQGPWRLITAGLRSTPR